MKMILYAGGELLTGDDIAVAVMQYSQALAEADTAEAIEIPIIDADGTPSAAIILVGPASQIIARDAHTDIEELIDEEVVRTLEEKTREHRPVATMRPPEPRDESSDAMLDEF